MLLSIALKSAPGIGIIIFVIDMLSCFQHGVSEIIPGQHPVIKHFGKCQRSAVVYFPAGYNNSFYTIFYKLGAYIGSQLKPVGRIGFGIGINAPEETAINKNKFGYRR